MKYIFKKITLYCDSLLNYQDNLSTALVGKTCITMCHTVTNVSKFDQIFVMVHGHVVESGNHQQLWDLRGHYWAMWRANNNSKWQH